jgi:hypothetical protein
MRSTRKNSFARIAGCGIRVTESHGDAVWCASRLRGQESMARAKARAHKKAKKPRITVTMSPDVNRRLKALAAANQRSVAWIINYAIGEILEKYEGNPAPQLPVRSSLQHG